MKQEHQQLIAAYLSGKSVSDELMAACREDSEVLKVLSEMVSMDRLLYLEAGDEGAEMFASEVRQRLESGVDESFSKGVRQRLECRKRNRLVWFVPLAAAACLTVALLLFQNSGGEPDLGRLTATRDAEWAGSAMIRGDALKKGSLTLNHGYSEITMNNGVTLVLEAPVEIEVESLDKIRLMRGRLVAKVPEAAIGFTVLTPNSEVVDLGTEFGMSVDASGASEVHVLDGEVKARPLNGKKFTSLVRDEAMAFTDKNTVSRMRSQPETYLRALPGRSSENPEYLHWSCDEGSEVLSCEGTGIGGKFFPGELKSFKGGEGPVYANGQFGEALYFNGKDAYVVTEFSGIGGNAPRTVAFWAKVPRDFDIHNGYGMLGWGRMSEGSAWQISPNPAGREGPLGRLRVGTYQAPVIGSTDLRDNRWHHIAVVMYGGESANSATHVLLYVDGQLETTTTKSVAAIDTQLDHPKSRPLMMGRNLGFGDESRRIESRFFKGWLDEIYVFDTALDQEQIQQLMQSNHWK
ncbi:MAG: FecR domain-containing protein [Opitutales bacterium]|nr:FecR domain-containing protein [Akkermansiaceae bacterium]MDP4644875.1 FecR domain-containing protein [Opitutales bacterium]MDP4720235.1 FecR domain-containing protein [Akkermansiaceae bacterium]MDP4793573.1 FecR domain-containing protein [Verrucomicrobiales bacterium]MDP4898751.1 FecR domain-containing protein [Akkermansiaceae bacterium]